MATFLRAIADEDVAGSVCVRDVHCRHRVNRLAASQFGSFSNTPCPHMILLLASRHLARNAGPARRHLSATPGCLAEAASQEWTLSGNQFTWLGDRCWPVSDRRLQPTRRRRLLTLTCGTNVCNSAVQFELRPNFCLNGSFGTPIYPIFEN